MTFLVLAILAADCNLPAPKWPKEWSECKQDDDCTLASDVCRQCENFIPVNKAFETAATTNDLDQRLSAKCVRPCSGCPQETVELKCIDRYCSAKRVKKAAAAAPQPAQPAKPTQPAQPAGSAPTAKPAPQPQPAPAEQKKP